MNIPSHLIPVNVYHSPMEVVGEVREKRDQEGAQKRSGHFDALGWVVPVEVVRGTRQKPLPDGSTATVLDVDRLNVTVWSNTTPRAMVGSYVEFISPMIGAMDGNIYVQALGVNEHQEDETDDGLDSLMEVN